MFPQTDPQLSETLESADGGANQRALSWLLQPNEYRESENVHIPRPGIWSRRLGVAPRGGQYDPPGGLWDIVTASDSARLRAIWGSNMYRLGGSGTWTREASGASFISGALHQAVEGAYIASSFKSGQYKASYLAQVYTHSGTTLATNLMVLRAGNISSDNNYTQTASYAPLVITWFQNRLWKANDQFSGDGSDLAWSELDDGLTYSPANSIEVERGRGGDITALYAGRSDAPVLYIFKKNLIASLRPRWGIDSAYIPSIGDELDTINSQLIVLNQQVGCVATRSLVPALGFRGGDALFLSRDGVRALARAEDDTVAGVGPRLSEKIPDWIDAINWDYAYKAVGAVYDNAYHLAVPMSSATENNRVLRMDLATGAWSLLTWEPRDLAVRLGEGVETFFMQYNTPYTNESSVTGLPDAPLYSVYRGYTGDTDPGATVIRYSLQTRALVFQQPRIEKRWDHLMLLGTVDADQEHFLRVVYRVDNKDWTTLPSLVSVGTPGDNVVQGVTPLPWLSPRQKLTQRRIDLLDVEPGTIIEFRLLGEDSARPQYYYFEAQAKPLQQIFDNSR